MSVKRLNIVCKEISPWLIWTKCLPMFSVVQAFLCLSSLLCVCLEWAQSFESISLGQEGSVSEAEPGEQVNGGVHSWYSETCWGEWAHNIWIHVLASKRVLTFWKEPSIKPINRPIFIVFECTSQKHWGGEDAFGNRENKNMFPPKNLQSPWWLLTQSGRQEQRQLIQFGESL